MTRRQKRCERNRRRGRYGVFIASFPGRCWYCAEEVEDTECDCGEDDVLVHTGCLVCPPPAAGPERI